MLPSPSFQVGLGVGVGVDFGGWCFGVDDVGGAGVGVADGVADGVGVGVAVGVDGAEELLALPGLV